MSRIQDYPEATSMADDDILVIDGDSGTRKVKKSKFVEIISEHVDGEIEEMRQDFQDGVDTIYDTIDDYVTPAASTPSALAAAVDDVYTKGKTDAESVTWTEDFFVSVIWYIGNTVQSQSNTTIGADNIISMEVTDVVDDVTAANRDYKIYFMDSGNITIDSKDITAGAVYTVPDSAKAIRIRITKQRDSTPTLNNISIRFRLTRQTKILR